MNEEFNFLQQCILIGNIDYSTRSQFNVLSGGLTECLVEPRHVGVSTAGSLLTRALLMNAILYYFHQGLIEPKRQEGIQLNVNWQTGKVKS